MMTTVKEQANTIKDNLNSTKKKVGSAIKEDIKNIITTHDSTGKINIDPKKTTETIKNTLEGLFKKKKPADE